uniref:Uncharacterized protein n=1 Tax=Cannabis sativa TaxID=3483 RepID=A0A803Q1X9_CANSA
MLPKQTTTHQSSPRSSTRGPRGRRMDLVRIHQTRVMLDGSTQNNGAIQPQPSKTNQAGSHVLTWFEGWEHPVTHSGMTRMEEGERRVNTTTIMQPSPYSNPRRKIADEPNPTSNANEVTRYI